MAVSVRFHREDPWERIRLVSAAMPNTPLNLITTGMRFISWVPAGEDVMRLSFRCVVRNGIRRFQIADPSNDPRSLIRLARMAREEGVEEVVVGLTYSISPVHTHDYYIERARAVAESPDIDRLYLKDPGGLLTPDAVRELAPAFVAAFAPRPVELHSHCTIGLAPLAYLEGLRAGIRTLHTAVAPVAHGTSNPPAETTLRNLEAEGFSHGLDLDALAAVSEHFRDLALAKGLPLGAPADYDAGYYHHQMPGGMVTHHPPHARRAAPARAVRRDARGGHARTRGDGLPDHGHAGVAVRRHAGGDEHHLRRALVAGVRRDGALLPRATTTSPPRRRTRT